MLEQLKVLRNVGIIDLSSSSFWTINAKLMFSENETFPHGTIPASNGDPGDVTLHVVQQTDIDDTMKALSDDGYGDGPPVSHYFMLAEGDEVELNFRGNVKSSKSQ